MNMQLYQDLYQNILGQDFLYIFYAEIKKSFIRIMIQKLKNGVVVMDLYFHGINILKLFN